jgi:xanthine dehydrogenase accessory factor
MHKDLQLWPFVAAYLKQKIPVMLLVVAESSGSSPGRRGFKMAIAADGVLCGSIGGGVMEVKLVELAKTRLAQNIIEATIKKQIHRKSAPQHQSGMICSGEQTVLFFRLDFQHLKTVRQVVQALKQHRQATLTLAQREQGPQFYVATTDEQAPFYCFESAGPSHFIYKEKLGYRKRLYIVGGGHCALALSELLSKLDFYLCLLDDRADLNTLQRNKFVHEKHVLTSYDGIANFISSGPDVYVVIMTLGYRSDAQVLRQLLGKELHYLGMLGSAAKWATLLQELTREGYAPEALARVRAPIGLPIHSQTPEEIAVSIAAELILISTSA